MSAKKILVTGASGMLGQALSDRLRLGYEVTAVSRRGQAQTTAVDLTDRAATQEMFKGVSPELVIHCAAASDVDACEKDPQTAWRVNALSTRYLSEICSRRKIPLVHVSTDYVFNGRKKTPYVEDDPTFPVNVYGMTKLAAEAFIRCESTDAVIVRTSWLFGRGNPSNFVNAILKRLLAGEHPAILADQHSAPTYTVDLAAALERIAADRLARSPAGGSGVRTYHVCNRGSATRYEMAVRMKQILRRDSVEIKEADVSQIQNRVAVRPVYSVMSGARFEKDFGTALRPWQEALEEYLKTEPK